MWRCSVRSVLRRAKVPRGVYDTVRPVSAVKVGSNGACSSVSGNKWVRPSGFDTGLKTFNSLTKQKEPLILAREGVATWYGMSSYDI